MLDWYHKEYFDIIQGMLTPNADPRVFSDNNLINGKMHFDCSQVQEGDTTPCTNNAGLSKFMFKRNKVHRLRLINSGADGVQRFSIDDHSMTVIAEDFVPVKPYETQVVTLGVGQRTDVLVKANRNPGAYWIRSNLTSCSSARQPNALAVVYYEGTDTNATPTSTAWDIPDPGTCANQDLDKTEPLYPIPLKTPTLEQTLAIDIFRNESNITLWKFNGVSMRTHYNKPVLLEANAGNLDFPLEWNVLNFSGNTSVRLIIQNNGPIS